MVGYWDAAYEVLELKDRCAVEDFLDGGLLVTGDVTHDAELFVAAWVFNDDVKEESVELSFGKRVGALLFDWVLGGEHEERLVEFVVDTAGGYSLFLHRLKKRCLGFRRCPVNFVS